MRTEGTLRNWNDDRGFGFVVTTETKQDVFVHISSFPHTGRRPQPGERLAFSIETGHDGKKRAVSVNYLDPPTAASLAAATTTAARATPGAPRAAHASQPYARGHRRVSGRHRGRNAPPRRVGGLLTLIAIAGIGTAIVYRNRSDDSPQTSLSQPVAMSASQHDAIAPPSPAAAPVSAPATIASPPQSIAAPARSFQCDGRTHCSQMTSCAEAEYFLRNCPNTQMDGNNDGEPCEQQWCH